MPRHQQQLEDEDRLSTLPDDILLSILGRVSLRIAARTCVLSTRWRHVPWLLPEVNIDVKDFLSVPRTEPIEAKEMEELAMVSLTKATWSFLADQQRKCTITSLHLKLYLTNTSLCGIGPLVGEAINNALLKELDLTVLDETDPLDCSDEDMLQRAQEIDNFFRWISKEKMLLWLQPEMEELCTAFSKLKKLSVCGVFVEFEILWIMAFLVAAPSIEKLHIQVWNHACDVGEFRGDVYRDRSTPQWEMRFNGFENRLLKVLEIDGFRALEQQFAFIRSMLECSPNLRKIILRGDDQCDDCRPLDASLRHPSKFPEKDEEEMVVERIIRDGIFSPEIIFDEDWSLSI
ncbi:hypothetical protein QYE76_060244 [Lolium multiflorum]|uniref:F-box domain-containing protein n=1 Tax=Lolium multiflorum TaxID=4521 RepID=A0AAD8W631_LOLMU|nr:hypothetical protein QYE76_060244 [Lolium multiflorum]